MPKDNVIVKKAEDSPFNNITIFDKNLRMFFFQKKIANLFSSKIVS